MDHDDPLLAHKTTRRGFYDREHRRALAEGCFDALFVNRLDKVTEGGITNIFARFGATWVTPPVADGLLPGVWRAAFMEAEGSGGAVAHPGRSAGRRRDRGGQLGTRALS